MVVDVIVDRTNHVVHRVSRDIYVCIIWWRFGVHGSFGYRVVGCGMGLEGRGGVKR